ncbi:MAG: MaoC family dehydratase [Candidatus Portnoybacteria bacterium]|nr:MaoC family dehydratase [Candidatus Portnoybacteria bacterium]
MPDQLKQFTYDQLLIGQKAEFDFLINGEVIADFVKLSGDANPIHTDPEYASETKFKYPVAHGMIAGMLFSRLIGMELPGKYSLYLSQSLNFHRPMLSGQQILVSGIILHKNDAFHTIALSTKIIDKSSEDLLVDGQALIRVLK